MMNESSKKLAEYLISLELKLNELTSSKIQIGSLMSHFFDDIYREKNELQILTLIKLISIPIRALYWSFCSCFSAILTPKYYGNKILFSKVDDITQCSLLIDPLYENYSKNSIIRCPRGINDIEPYNFYKKLRISHSFKAILILIRILSKIKINLRGVNKLNFCYTLIFKINEFYNWNKFFKNSDFELVLVDYDRNTRNNSLVLAAKANKIKTITLVHGVINPPYGYWPVIADEIWCWSKFQKNQLMENYVESTKIKIVGSSIARKMVSKNKLSFETLGIALGNVGDEVNYQMIRLLYENLNGFRVIIKLHPSMVYSNWMSDFSDFNFYSHAEMSQKAFLTCADLIIVGNSGFGFEAVVNDTPIWVFRISQDEFGHDHVMIKYANCPEISVIENLKAELIKLDNQDYLKDLLEEQQRFVLNEFYGEYGSNSVNQIVHRINDMINE